MQFPSRYHPASLIASVKIPLPKTLFRLCIISSSAALFACGGAVTDDAPSSSSSSSSSSSGIPTHPDTKTIQAEDYTAWYDTDSGNKTSAYRQDDVDISNSSSGYEVTHIETSEWLEYDLKIDQAGTYTATLHHQAESQTSSFSLVVNGENRAQGTAVPGSSGTNLALSHLPAGDHVLRIYFTNATAENLRLDRLSITPIEYGDAPPSGKAVFPEGDANAGSALYAQQCSFCHGDQGEGNASIQAPGLIECATCDNYQGLAKHIADSMPTSNPSNCEGQCAADVAAYIQEDFNKPFDAGSCTQSAEQEVTPDTLKRLSRNEYILTTKDLLAIPDSEIFEELPTDARSHNFNTLADKQNVSTNYMRAYLAIAERQAQAVLTDPVRRQKVIGCNINQGSPPGGNLALPGTASASSSYSAAYTANQSNDADMSTRWNAGASTSGDQWLEINFGANRTFNTVVLKEAFDRVSSHKIQLWTGSGWSNIVSGSTIGSNKIHTFSAVTTTRVRLYVNAASNSVSIWEFEVYNDDGSGIPNSSSDNCYSNFLGRFGRLAYRRPVTSIERDEITNFANQHAKDNADKFALTIELFLTSPLFLYRDETGGDWTECSVESGICEVNDWSKIRYGANGHYAYTRGKTDLHCSHTEFGDPIRGTPKKCYVSPIAGPLELNEYQMASRLSFSLWGRGPDKNLLDQAQSGALNTAEGRRQVIQEMLQDDKSKQHFAEFFTQWLALFRLTTPDDKPQRWYDGAIADMKTETQALLSEHAWQGKNFLDVLTANHTYVNSNLAKYYGFGDVSGKMEFDEGDPKAHTGILTHGANMFRKTDGDLVSIRGNWLRDTFLCKDIVLPASAQNAIANNFAGFSTLEVIKARNEELNCKGCHAKIDPIGIVLRSFDGTGLFDYGLNLSTYPVAPGFPDMEQAHIRTAKDLAFHLSMMPEVGRCLTKRMFLYTRFKEPSKADNCAIEKAASEFEASNFDLQTLIMSLTGDDNFTYRKLPR